MHLVSVTQKQTAKLHDSIIVDDHRLAAHFMRMDGRIEIKLVDTNSNNVL